MLIHPFSGGQIDNSANDLKTVINCASGNALLAAVLPGKRAERMLETEQDGLTGIARQIDHRAAIDKPPAIAGPAAKAVSLRSPMAGALQPMLDLQPFAGRHQFELVVPGLDTGQGLWMDLIDGDMDMKMSRIGVDRRDPLMPAQSDCLAKLIFNIAQLLKCRPFARREGDDQMIGPLALGAVVAILGDADLQKRVFQLLRIAIADADIRSTQSGSEDVSDIIRRPLPFGGFGLGNIGAKPLEAAALGAMNPLGNHRRSPAAERGMSCIGRSLLILSIADVGALPVRLAVIVRRDPAGDPGSAFAVLRALGYAQFTRYVRFYLRWKSKAPAKTAPAKRPVMPEPSAKPVYGFPKNKFYLIFRGSLFSTS